MNQAATPAPRASMNTFLETQRLLLDGPEPRIMLGATQIVFPPEGSLKPQVVIKQNGTVLHTDDHRSTEYRGGAFWEQSTRTPSAIGLGTENGTRTIEVHLNGQVIGKFEFTLTKQQNGDPLDPKTTWKVVGPWKDLGYFMHQPQPDQSRKDVFFVYWVALHELTPESKTVTLTVRKGSTVIAKARENYPAGLPYSRFEVQLQKPNNDGFQVKDLAAHNGPVVVEVKQGARVLRSWNATIANGAIVPHKRSDHNTVDPLEYLPPRRISGNSVNIHTMYWVTR